MKHIQGTSVTGYVTVLIKGDQPELFFQSCIEQEIPAWDITKISATKCKGNVRLSDIHEVRKLHRNTDYKITFPDRRGFPFILKRFLRRKEIIIGLVLGIMFIFFLSNIIWKVEIHGIPTDMEEKVIKQLDSYGIHSGTWIFSLDEPTAIQQKLMTDIPELLWIGIKRKGTTYSLEGVEKIIIEEEKPPSPRNLIASKKGIITSMYVSKGVPKVQIHDYVETGELLVSGTMQVDDDDKKENKKEEKKKQEIVASEAEVIAETWYESEVTIPLEGSYEMITGEKDFSYHLSVGHLSIPIWGFKDPDYKDIQRETSEKPLYFFRWKLPLTVKKTTLNEMQSKKIKRSREQARKVGIEQAKEELRLRLGPDARIMSHKILHEAVESGKVKLNIYITVEEDIAKPQSISQGD